MRLVYLKAGKCKRCGKPPIGGCSHTVDTLAAHDPDHKAGDEVKVGDRVTTSSGQDAVVDFFRPPHKASSTGKVSIKFAGTATVHEYYVSVIGAKWVDREDGGA